MSQMLRGGLTFWTRSWRDVAPIAPLRTASWTGPGLRLNATTSCPPRARRWTILPPMRPRPTKPSCICRVPPGLSGIQVSITQNLIQVFPQRGLTVQRCAAGATQARPSVPRELIADSWLSAEDGGVRDRVALVEVFARRAVGQPQCALFEVHDDRGDGDAPLLRRVVLILVTAYAVGEVVVVAETALHVSNRDGRAGG